MPVSEATVRQIYKPLESGDWETFLSHVRDDVSWRVGNNQVRSFQVAGEFDKKGFLSVFKPLGTCFPKTIALKIENILVDSNGTAAVEMSADTVANDGSRFVNFYCWVTEFDTSNPPMIKAFREYLDTAHVRDTMERNGIGM